jgi:hypothetical protein
LHMRQRRPRFDDNNRIATVKHLDRASRVHPSNLLCHECRASTSCATQRRARRTANSSQGSAQVESPNEVYALMLPGDRVSLTKLLQAEGSHRLRRSSATEAHSQHDD